MQKLTILLSESYSFKQLKHANLNKNEHTTVIPWIDYSKKGTFYEQSHVSKCESCFYMLWFKFCEGITLKNPSSLHTKISNKLI